MPIDVQKAPDEPIIAIICHDPFSPEDGVAAHHAISDHYSPDGEVLIVIFDTASLTAPLDRVMVQLFASADGSKWHIGAMNSRTVFVALNEQIELADDVLDLPEYEHIYVELFDDFEDALAYARYES